jgi:hypothetical protein
MAQAGMSSSKALGEGRAYTVSPDMKSPGHNIAGVNVLITVGRVEPGAP